MTYLLRLFRRRRTLHRRLADLISHRRERGFWTGLRFSMRARDASRMEAKL